jgi:regulator of sigma E protease
MEFLNTTAAFIFVLGIIIFVHEFGHFLTAKAFGMRVFVFSFGFGKRLLGFKWGDTDCRLSLVPLGGYVKLEGEPDDKLSQDVSALGDGKDFVGRPRWQRFVVYLAGPFMNAALTLGVLTVLFMIGSQADATLYDRPVIGAVEAGSPAERAGVLPGDEILAIDEREPSSWEDAQYAILLRPDARVKLRVRRGADTRELELQSQARGNERVGHLGVAPLVRVGNVLPGQPAEAAGLRKDDAILAIDGQSVAAFEDIPRLLAAGGERALSFRIYRDGSVSELPVTPRGGRIGIERKTVLKKFGLGGAFAEAWRFSWNMTRLTFETLGRLVTAQISPKTMMGPLGIAQASGDAARGGWASLFFLVAIISLQVGILNLFPLAPLDGGHMAILAGESLMRRDLSLAVKSWIMNAGAAVLFLLIGLVLYSDLSKTSWLGRFLP